MCMYVCVADDIEASISERWYSDCRQLVQDKRRRRCHGSNHVLYVCMVRFQIDGFNIDLAYFLYVHMYVCVGVGIRPGCARVFPAAAVPHPRVRGRRENPRGVHHSASGCRSEGFGHN